MITDSYILVLQLHETDSLKKDTASLAQYTVSICLQFTHGKLTLMFMYVDGDYDDNNDDFTM